MLDLDRGRTFFEIVHSGSFLRTPNRLRQALGFAHLRKRSDGTARMSEPARNMRDIPPPLNAFWISHSFHNYAD